MQPVTLKFLSLEVNAVMDRGTAPVAVMVKVALALLPARTGPRLSEEVLSVIAAMLAVMVKVLGLETLGFAWGVDMVIEAVPAEATSDAGTVAMSCLVAAA